MALEEAAAWLDGDLILPIGGKKYRVPEPSAELGMRLEAIAEVGLARASELLADHAGVTVPPRQPSQRAQQLLDDDEERDLYREVLGPAYEQLVKDVTWPRLKHAAVTAILHFTISPEAAEANWNRGPAAGKAAGRSSRPATRRTTAAASTTRKPASGSGTRPRRSS